MSSRQVDWTNQGDKKQPKPFKKKIYQSKGISSGGYNPYKSDEDSRSVSSSGSKYSTNSGKPRSVKLNTVVVKGNSGRLSSGDIKFIIHHDLQDLVFIKSKKLLLDYMISDYDEGDRLLAWIEDGTQPEYEEPKAPTGASPSE